MPSISSSRTLAKFDCSFHNEYMFFVSTIVYVALIPRAQCNYLSVTMDTVYIYFCPCYHGYHVLSPVTMVTVYLCLCYYGHNVNLFVSVTMDTEYLRLLPWEHCIYIYILYLYVCACTRTASSDCLLSWFMCSVLGTFITICTV